MARIPEPVAWIFWGTAACEAALIAGLLVGVAWPGRRIWPPPGRRSWQFRGVWGLTGLAYAGIAATGVLDLGSMGWPPWARLGVGLPAFLGGFGFAGWAIAVLGWRRSSGLPGELATSGPYRWSRNPQYVGDAVGLLGWAVLCGSGLTLGLALVGSLSFLLAPLAEEPWLEERLGAEYREYRSMVPRYLGWPRREVRAEPGDRAP